MQWESHDPADPTCVRPQALCGDVSPTLDVTWQLSATMKNLAKTRAEPRSYFEMLPYQPSCERSAKSGYRRSAFSSKNAIHCFKNLEPLFVTCWLALSWHMPGGFTYLLMVSESAITQRCRFGRVMATFNRLFSPKKPTSLSGLLRTRLTTTASFSRP